MVEEGHERFDRDDTAAPAFRRLGASFVDHEATPDGADHPGVVALVGERVDAELGEDLHGDDDVPWEGPALAAVATVVAGR